MIVGKQIHIQNKNEKVNMPEEKVLCEIKIVSSSICDVKVKKIAQDIERLINLTKIAISALKFHEELVDKYCYCLRCTIFVALDETDALMEEHQITDELQINELRKMITDLLDEVNTLYDFI